MFYTVSFGLNEKNMRMTATESQSWEELPYKSSSSKMPSFFNKKKNESDLLK